MHPLREQMKQGQHTYQGITSYCTANEIVLEAAMEDAVARKTHVLIESTANQVNQFGGYTGMRPGDFADFALRIAWKTGLDEKLLILGGDHLGPLVWQSEEEASAMEKAEQLVREYVTAGFTKIHLDTSMRLANDSRNHMLPTETIARRGARLAKAALDAWEQRRARHTGAEEPVFVIGSEVPVPGGAQEDEDGISVTKPDDFENTVSVYRSVFDAEGLSDAWKNVIAVVVQPGVEFSDNTVFQYNPVEAAPLITRRQSFPELYFEGHSTDYQTRESLVNLVRDGVVILKVGPELTFSLREGLFALTRVEEELLPEYKRSHFRSVLESRMCKNPVYWEKYYHGSCNEQRLARMFSFSDRCRYYLADEDVGNAIKKLFSNLDQIHIPLSILHQYMPTVCDSLMESGEKIMARDIVKCYLKQGVIRKYQTAALENGGAMR